MTRLIAAILSLTLGLAAAFALVSCGSSDKGLLPGDTASQIEDNLDQVLAQAQNGDCEGAQASADAVSQQVDALGPEVKQRLREALAQGAEQVQAVVAQCTPTTVIDTGTTAPETALTDTETTATDTEPTETTTQTTETSQTTETTQSTETETTPTQPTTTAPTTPTPPPPGGGGNSGGGSGGIGPGGKAGLR